MENVLTNTTCGEACWNAQEEVCRCSCGGRNHGALKKDGTQPERTAIIDKVRYRLVAAGLFVDQQALALNKGVGITYFGAASARRHHGYTPLAIVRRATTAQVAKWPELVGERDRTAGMYPHQYASHTYLLWVRMDGMGFQHELKRRPFFQENSY